MSIEHDAIVKEMKLDGNISNLLQHLNREGYTLEGIGHAFHRETLKLFITYAREKYEGITDQLLVKMFSEWSAILTKDYLARERLRDAAR